MNPSDPLGPLPAPPSPEPPLAATPADQPLAGAPPAVVTPEEVEALFHQICRLQTALVVTLVALLILSLGLVLFMGKQMTTVRARLHADRQNAQQMFEDFQKNLSPKVRSFVRSLQVFAATNSDLTPILEKHRPVLDAYYLPAVPMPFPGGAHPPARNNAPSTNAPPAQPE